MGAFTPATVWLCQRTLLCCFNRLTACKLNSIERLWEELKADLKSAAFKTLDQLQAKVPQLLAQLTPEVIASITGSALSLDVLSAPGQTHLILKEVFYMH